MEYHSPTFNKYASCKNAKQLRRNQNTLNCPEIRTFGILAAQMLLNAKPEHSRCDLISNCAIILFSECSVESTLKFPESQPGRNMRACN